MDILIVKITHYESSYYKVKIKWDTIQNYDVLTVGGAINDFRHDFTHDSKSCLVCFQMTLGKQNSNYVIISSFNRLLKLSYSTGSWL